MSHKIIRNLDARLDREAEPVTLGWSAAYGHNFIVSDMKANYKS